MFLAALFGILTRPENMLAAFWPANALLLGTFVRNPHMVTARSWIAAILGYVLADMLTMNTPMDAEKFWLVALWLAAANLSGVVVSLIWFRRLPEGDRRLQRPLSVLYLLGICCVGAAVAALVGGGAALILFERDLLDGFAFWFSTELVNKIIILPVVLTAPYGWWRMLTQWRLRKDWNVRLSTLGPLLFLVFSMILGIVVGGPGALAFPLPALVWCALTYRLFPTALITMFVCVWNMITISTGLLHVPFSADVLYSLISLRLGIMFLAVGPLTIASINMMRNELLQNLDKAVNHDFLTDALSRRAFMKKGTELMQELTEEKQPVTVFMMDMDHFKNVNDRYGHAVGDRVLVAFANLMKSLLRKEDILGRLGGEEFGVILPYTKNADALKVAERILRAVREMPLTSEEGETFRVTVSIGQANDSEAGLRTLDQLLSSADESLYQAKRSGRDCVVAA